MIGTLITGALVGWIASKVMGTRGGLLNNILVGVIGSFVGNFALGMLGFYAMGRGANFLTAVAGACLFIWLGRKIFRL